MFYINFYVSFQPSRIRQRYQMIRLLTIGYYCSVSYSNICWKAHTKNSFQFLECKTCMIQVRAKRSCYFSSSFDSRVTISIKAVMLFSLVHADKIFRAFLSDKTTDQTFHFVFLFFPAHFETCASYLIAILFLL